MKAPDITLLPALFSLLSTLEGTTERQEIPRVALAESSQAKATDAPYMVALLKSKGAAIEGIILKTESPYCSGSIVNEKWVLTAAHCITLPSLPGSVWMVAGADTVSQFDEKYVQRRAGKEVHLHPQYWANRISKYDVALVRVDQFTFNDRVGKVTLWAQRWVEANPGSKHEYGISQCQAFGWGALEMGERSTSLRTVTLFVRHGTKGCPCFQMFHQRRMVCSQPGIVGGVCPGDSGGPLICDGIEVGVAHVLYHRQTCNLNTFGNLNLKCNDHNSISAWMYVCPMLDFIRDHVSDVPGKPESCRATRLYVKSCLIAVFSYVTIIVIFI